MVVVDTDLFIGALRNNGMAKTLLQKYADRIHISAVTAMELYVGATDGEKKKMVDEIMNEHEVIPFSKNISETAIRLLKEYNTGSRRLLIPDALIAATCLEEKAPLLTFNTKDYRFIKGLKLAN